MLISKEVALPGFGLVCLVFAVSSDHICQTLYALGGKRVEKESKQEKKKAALLFSLIATQSPPGTNTRFFGQIQQQPNATSQFQDRWQLAGLSLGSAITHPENTQGVQSKKAAQMQEYTRDQNSLICFLHKSHYCLLPGVPLADFTLTNHFCLLVDAHMNKNISAFILEESCLSNDKYLLMQNCVQYLPVNGHLLQS